MLISHRRRFIFVHVPKTAGQSVAAAFRPYADHPEQYLVNRLLGSLAYPLNRAILPVLITNPARPDLPPPRSRPHNRS